MAIARAIAIAATLSAVSSTACGQFDCATALSQQTFTYTDSWGWLGTNAAIVGDTLYQGIHWPGGVVTRYDISDPSNIVELPSLQLPPHILGMLNGFTDINARILVRDTAVHGSEILWASWFGLTVLDTQTGTFGWASTPDNPDFPWFSASVVPMGRTAWSAGDQLARVDIDAMYTADGTPGNEWDAPIHFVSTPGIIFAFSVVGYASELFVGGANSQGTPFVGTVDPMSNAFSGANLLSGGTATKWHATDSGFVVETVGFSRLPCWDLEAAPFPQPRLTNLAANERQYAYAYGDTVFALISSTGPLEMFILKRDAGSLSVQEFGDLTLPSTPGFPRGYESAAMDDNGVVYLIANEGTQTVILPIDVSACLVPPACPGDIADDFGTLGSDGMVSFGDFLALLGLIGPCAGGIPGCTGDIADDFGTLGPDGMVGFGDFLALLGLIGPCQ